MAYDGDNSASIQNMYTSDDTHMYNITVQSDSSGTFARTTRSRSTWSFYATQVMCVVSPMIAAQSVPLSSSVGTMVDSELTKTFWRDLTGSAFIKQHTIDH